MAKYFGFVSEECDLKKVWCSFTSYRIFFLKRVQKKKISKVKSEKLDLHTVQNHC